MATVAEPLVTPGEANLVYMARRQSLRLIRVPRGTLINPATGQREVGAIQGQAVAFHEGVLRVPKEGDMLLEDGKPAPASEIAEWLDSHRLNGNVEEGFWRVDPSAPPVSEDELGRLMDAALSFDSETLQEIVRQEREGWGRDVVIRRAEDALVKIADAERAVAEQQAQAAKKAPAKGGAS